MPGVPGLSMGVPGQVATWTTAVQKYGQSSFAAKTCSPRCRMAQKGFTISPDFVQQEEEALPDLQTFTASRKLFLKNGQPLPVGSTLRNPDLARTYTLLAKYGGSYLYDGALGADIAKAVQNPPTAPGNTFYVRPGIMTRQDLANYTAKVRAPTHVNYRGLDVYGMAPSSSGGTTVGEALNILSGWKLGSEVPRPSHVPVPGVFAAGLRRPQRLHRRLRLRPGSGAGPARPGVRGHPSLPGQGHGPDVAGDPRRAVRPLHRLRVRRARRPTRSTRASRPTT